MNRRKLPARDRRRRQGHNGSELPDLGCWVRLVRERRDLTRPRAADRLNISAGLLKKIENGDAPCSPTVLNHMVAAYELDRAQQRYTRALTQPPVPLAPVAELRTRASTPEHHAKLAYLDRRGLVGVYIDPLWNVVLANECFRAVLPAVEHNGDNLARWFFHPGSAIPTAEPLVVHWDSAATSLVANLRGAFGIHRQTPHAHALYQDLRGAATFNRTWDTSIAVAYGHQPQEPVHLRDTATGDQYSAHIHLGAQDSTDLRICIAYPTTASDQRIIETP